jgi:hypothetical protein
MSDDSQKDEKKKDLTGILELSALMPPASAEELLKDPFAVNEIQPVEQVDDFQSIESMDMIDHEPAPEPAASAEAPPPIEAASDDAFPVSGSPSESEFSIDLNSPSEPAPTNDWAIVPEAPATSAGTPFNFALDTPSESDPSSLGQTGDNTPTTGFSFKNDTAPEVTSASDPFPHAAQTRAPSEPAATGMDGVKQYSERSRESTFSKNAKNPFHLWMHGSFDPYSRDKLLLFITENPMGLNSSELDRQINAGKVLFPRISEFAGIKLIQDLRDSGLSFKLTPSSRDADEVIPEAQGLRLAFEANAATGTEHALPVLPEGVIDTKLWQAFDSIQLVQFLKAEILEVERSDLFQELLERMTISLKQKARLRGANAIADLQHQLKPLRLPSQYQIELKATLLKKL